MKSGRQKKGARSLFFHPATIAIFSILTLGLYGIGVGIHALVTKGSEIDKLDAKSTEIPVIRSKKDLIKYLIKCCEDVHTVNGKSEEAGEAQDKEGKKAKLFTFKGIVFRGDRRPPEEIKKAGGFKSQNDLSDQKNMREAQGVGASKGATGKSGVSCADQFTGATGYFDLS